MNLTNSESNNILNELMKISRDLVMEEIEKEKTEITKKIIELKAGKKLKIGVFE